MSAHQMYELLVGEIGIEPHVFLYDLTLWQARAIVRGYYKRMRTSWEQTRLLVTVFAGAMGAEMKEIVFPWEEEKKNKKEDKEALERLLAEAREHNRKLEEQGR